MPDPTPASQTARARIAQVLDQHIPNEALDYEQLDALTTALLALVQPANTDEDALRDVIAERRRQNAKWGEQNHPDGTGDQEHPLVDLAYYRSSELFERMTAGSLAYRAKDATDRAAREGRGTWAAILLEEVFEALAEDDPAALRTELIQVAAVATQWVEAIDRRTR